MKRTHGSLETRPLLKPKQDVHSEEDSAESIRSKQNSRIYVEQVMQGDLSRVAGAGSDGKLVRYVNELELDALMPNRASLATVTEVLEQCASVRTLTLGDELDFSEITPFADALAANTTLETLHIQNCDGFHPGAPLEQLARGIAGNTGLKTLVLEYENDAEEDQLEAGACSGLAALGASLANHPSLDCLQLEFPDLRPQQVHALVAGLAGNCTLTRLVLQADRDDARLQMTLALDRGALPRLEHLQLNNGCLSQVQWPEVATLSRLLSRHKALRTVELPLAFFAPEYLDTLAQGLALSHSITSMKPPLLETPWQIPPAIWTTLQRNRAMDARFGDTALIAACQAFTGSWGQVLKKDPGMIARNQVGQHLAAMLAPRSNVARTQRHTGPVSSINLRTAFARHLAAEPLLINALMASYSLPPKARNFETP